MPNTNVNSCLDTWGSSYSAFIQILCILVGSSYNWFFFYFLTNICICERWGKIHAGLEFRSLPGILVASRGMTRQSPSRAKEEKKIKQLIRDSPTRHVGHSASRYRSSGLPSRRGDMGKNWTGKMRIEEEPTFLALFGQDFHKFLPLRLYWVTTAAKLVKPRTFLSDKREDVWAHRVLFKEFR